MSGCRLGEGELGEWVMIAGSPYFAYHDVPDGADTLGEVRSGGRPGRRPEARGQVGVLFPSGSGEDECEPFAIQAVGSSSRLLWRRVGAIQVLDPDGPGLPASWVVVLAHRRDLPASLAAATAALGVAVAVSLL